MTMSQGTVESILGRLITDAQFRGEFLAAPIEVGRRRGFDASDDELALLASVDPIALQAIAGCLDPKIVRASGAAIASHGNGGWSRR